MCGGQEVRANKDVDSATLVEDEPVGLLVADVDDCASRIDLAPQQVQPKGGLADCRASVMDER
jgi:hypothetical protein